eukprot:5079620-Prymnesium_polylepis.2
MLAPCRGVEFEGPDHIFLESVGDSPCKRGRRVHVGTVATPSLEERAMSTCTVRQLLSTSEAKSIQSGTHHASAGTGHCTAPEHKTLFLLTWHLSAAVGNVSCRAIVRLRVGWCCSMGSSGRPRSSRPWCCCGGFPGHHRPVHAAGEAHRAQERGAALLLRMIDGLTLAHIVVDHVEEGEAYAACWDVEAGHASRSPFVGCPHALRNLQPRAWGPHRVAFQSFVEGHPVRIPGDVLSQADGSHKRTGRLPHPLPRDHGPRQLEGVSQQGSVHALFEAWVGERGRHLGQGPRRKSAERPRDLRETLCYLVTRGHSVLKRDVRRTQQLVVIVVADPIPGERWHLGGAEAVDHLARLVERVLDNLQQSAAARPVDAVRSARGAQQRVHGLHDRLCIWVLFVIVMKEGGASEIHWLCERSFQSLSKRALVCFWHTVVALQRVQRPLGPHAYEHVAQVHAHLRVRPLLENFDRTLGALTPAREDEGGLAVVLVLHDELWVGVEHQLHQLRVRIADRPHQNRRAVRRGGLRVGSELQHPLRRYHVPRLARAYEGALTARVSGIQHRSRIHSQCSEGRRNTLAAGKMQRRALDSGGALLKMAPGHDGPLDLRLLQAHGPGVVNGARC